MAHENVSKFEEMLRGSEELQSKLQELVSSYEGDKADEQAVFDATIGQLAAGVGLPISFEDACDFALANRELSDAELDAVAGGYGVCYMIGGSNEVEAECQNNAYIGHACSYVGVSF